MNKIDLNNILKSRLPKFQSKSIFVQKLYLFVISKITHLDKINSILNKLQDKKGIEFIDDLFEILNFTFKISNKDVKKIPAEGKLICVANHPIGSLDGLALLKVISEIREDVKIVANDILYEIENLKDLFIPFNIYNNKISRDKLDEINKSLQNEEAVIIFPAAEVSRLKFYHITDSKWHKGAVYFSKKNEAPILPIYIKAKNSILFYLISTINKRLSTLFLAHELFNKKNKTIELKIDNPVPYKAFKNNFLNDNLITTLLRKHVIRLGKNKKGVFFTEKNIIHPISRKFIKRELVNSELLGETSDNKKIYLCNYFDHPQIMNEIARLREITFRKVGEGTGNKLDIDKFDKIYKHIIIWDEIDLEIVGAYRLGLSKEIIENFGVTGFYTSTLFTFSESFKDKYLNSSLELGRSFIQKKYWKTNALHFLWQGIGAFIYKHPEIKYLFGGVSISNNYSGPALEMIVYYFTKWYGNFSNNLIPKNEYVLSEKSKEIYKNEFNGSNHIEDFKILKNMLKPLGFSVPTLYKQYTDLCYKGGAQFLGFSVDNSFEKCVDGFILVDVNKITKEKRSRYISVHEGENEVA